MMFPTEHLAGELVVAADCYTMNSHRYYSMQFQADIYITLRPSILDPAGTAVESSLHQLGHPDVSQVRIGKLVQLHLEASDLEKARSRVEQMCDQMLANPVIEVFQVSVQSLERRSEGGRDLMAGGRSG